MGKGSNTSSTSSTTRADPQAEAAYRDLITRAQGIASTPYQAYTGDLTADVNAQQTAGIAGINANAGYASPYISQAAGMATTAAGPIDAATIQRYQNPYTQQVVDATTAQLRNEFGRQHAGLTSNAISQGALGGNGVGVARGILSGQQGRTMASTVAGLYDKSYQQALQAAQDQQKTGLAGANAIANYGISGQNAALQGAGAQINAGTLQQQTEQARLDALYKQYLQQQAFPYQQAQWLAGVATGVGSNLGGTSSGTTTGPAPNSTGQWIGAGLSAASLFLSDERAKEDIEHIGHTNDGQKIYRFRYKGDPSGRVHMGLIAQEVERDHPDSVGRGLGGLRVIDMEGATDDSVRRAAGGGVGAVPWAGAPSWIPQMNIHAGSGPPQARAPSLPEQKSSFDPAKAAQNIVGIGKGLTSLDWSGAAQAGLGNLSGDDWGGGSFWKGDAYGGSSASPLPGLSAADYGEGFATGGGVTGAEFAVGDRVSVANGKEHSSMDSGAVGTVNEVSSPALAIKFDGMPRVHKWYIGAELKRRRAAGGAVDDPESDYNRGLLEAAVDDPASDYNRGLSGVDPMGPVYRGIGHDMLRRGEGIRSPDFIPGGEPPPDHGLPVFDQNGRMLGNQTSAQGQVPNSAPVVAEEEEPAAPPTDVSGRTRGLGRPGVAAFAPDGPASYGAMPDAVTRPQPRESGIGLGLISPNAQSGLLAAGLGMLASRSPFLGNVVGEGGLAGLGAYGAAEERDRQAAAEAEKLSREAREKAQKFGLDVRKQDEVERHNRASEKISANKEKSDRAPMGMRFNAKGELEAIPGWLNTLEAAAKARKGPEGELMDDQTAEFMAHRILAGDTKVLTGLGRGAQGAQNIAKVQSLVAKLAAEGAPVSAAAREILQNAAQFEGLKAAERTQAAIMSKLSVYGRTAFNATAIAEKLSDEVDRTQFMPVNKIFNAAREKAGDPKIVALGQALMTLTNEYARAIGGGHGTVHDKEAAEKRLSAAQSKEQLRAVINVMRQEILAEEKAMPAARQHIRDIYNPKPGGGVKSIAGEHGAEMPAGPVPGASGFKPPPGAIARTYNGKVYYYDPNTKQPYPGQ